MAFDLESAKPVESAGFDLASAKPAEEAPTSYLDRARAAGARGLPTADKRWGAALDHVPYEVGGKVTDLATGVGLPASVAAGAGYVANVATQAVPALFGGELAKGAAPVLESGARRVMQSALKPAVADQRAGKAAKAIDTMLREGINVSEGGAAKLSKEIEELNDAVQQAIKGSSATIDASKAASRVADVAKRAMNSVKGSSDLATIKATLLEFFDNPLVQQYGGQLPIQIAQDIKKGSYKILGDKAYGAGLKPMAEQDATKAIVRGLKEEMEAAVPGIAPLNARESELINARKILERRNMVSGNHNPLGLSAIAAHPAGFWAHLLSGNNYAKSLAARAMYSGREQIPAAAARAGVAGYETLLDPVGLARQVDERR